MKDYWEKEVLAPHVPSWVWVFAVEHVYEGRIRRREVKAAEKAAAEAKAKVEAACAVCNKPVSKNAGQRCAIDGCSKRVHTRPCWPKSKGVFWCAEHVKHRE